MPPISVLIKPASGKCNMSCRYCFYHSLAQERDTCDFGFMSEETIETIIRKVLDFADHQATFSFQGGEPTLRGLDFFKKVVSLQRKYNSKNVLIQNCIQTNGILIDEEWAQFLGENDFLVGLSLDGPKKQNDALRIDTRGDGTYDRVMKTAALFDAHRVEYNILFVVTGPVARNAKKTYDFFRDKGFNFLQFIPCLEPFDQKRGLYDYSLSSDDYFIFLKEFFERWQVELLSGKEISVRYFDNLVRMVMGQPPETCSLMGCCRCEFVFEADGSVYPCDFYATDEWRMGSIHEMDITQLISTQCVKDFLQASAAVHAQCRQCEVYGLCRGGCRRDRETERVGVLGLNYYCKAYKSFLRYSLPKLKKLAEYVLKLQSFKQV